MKINTLISRLGIKMIAARIDERPDSRRTGFDQEWAARARHWRIVLTRKEPRARARRMRLYFTQGSAHTEPPTIIDVLDCLASDAAGLENAPAFEVWASEYGYDADSRKAYAVWRAVTRQTEALKRLIGSTAAYEILLWKVERE